MTRRNIPFLRLLLPFGLGVALGGWYDRPLPGIEWALGVGAALLLLLAYAGYAHRRRWIFGANAYLVFGLAGYAHTVGHNEIRDPAHFSTSGALPAFIIGTVYDAPAKGARLKVPLRVEAAGRSADALQNRSGNLLLFLPLDSSLPVIRYGDRLAVRAAILPTQPAGNPHAFDYGRYLHFQNIHFQAFVKSDSLRVLSSGQGWLLWRWAFGCRDRLLVLLRKYFPSTDEYAAASALLVGYKDELSDDLRTAYAETGSMHALAVSGTHVGILYAGLLVLLGRLRGRGRLGHWTHTGLILSVIWGFTLLTGATASVMRASLMFSTFLLGKGLRRDASIWNILGASAFGLLLLNPYFLFDAGFQLSYAAVGGMVFFYPRLQKIWPARRPRWAVEGWKVLLIGIAAQLGTLPLSLFYFHQFPCYFWLAGWVVVLGGAIFLWGGAALVLLDWLWPMLAGWLGKALYGMVWSINQLIVGIGGLPGSVVSGIWLPGWAAAVLYVSLITFAAALVTRRAVWLLATLGLLLALGIGRAIRARERLFQAQIVVYQVNNHRLIDFFDGENGVISMDSLPARQVLFAAQPHRWACGIRRVTALAPGQPFEEGRVLVRPPFVQVATQKIVLLDDVRWVEAGQPLPLPVDVVVLSGNPRVRMADCLRRFPCARVVADASNSRKNAARWSDECRALGVAFHDVRTQGAWVWTGTGH